MHNYPLTSMALAAERHDRFAAEAARDAAVRAARDVRRQARRHENRRISVRRQVFRRSAPAG